MYWEEKINVSSVEILGVVCVLLNKVSGSSLYLIVMLK
jgi:hypothetical protein